MSSLYPCGHLLPGTSYLLISILGEGTFGTVYLAYDQNEGMHVAVKVLVALHEHDPGGLRFQEERRALGHLRHKHIVRIITSGFTNDQYRIPFIVTELLSGKNLRALLVEAGGPLGFEKTLDIALELVSALIYTHRRKILHRDLKPENVFLSEVDERFSEVKIVDFGMARTGPRKSFTPLGLILGTPEYSAPELFANTRPSVESDLYAVGIMMVEMLTGRLPFRGVDSWVTAHYTLARALPDVLHRVPMPLVETLQCLLDPDPGLRYSNAERLDADLRRIRLARGEYHRISEFPVTTEFDPVESIVRKHPKMPSANEVVYPTVDEPLSFVEAVDEGEELPENGPDTIRMPSAFPECLEVELAG